jgi:ketosteroid isomerase-like protein
MNPGCHRPTRPATGIEMRTPELTDDAFFAALLEADAQRLDGLLSEDFMIIDVMSGTAIDRDAFTTAVRERVVTFAGIEVGERSTRHYSDAAIIVGRTAMRGSFADTDFSVASRYTHVFVTDADGRRLLASAQGTPITASA